MRKCPRPTKPVVLIPLADNYLDSPENAEILAKNRVIESAYTQAWIDAVLCYERQLDTAKIKK